MNSKDRQERRNIAEATMELVNSPPPEAALAPFVELACDAVYAARKLQDDAEDDPALSPWDKMDPLERRSVVHIIRAVLRHESVIAMVAKHGRKGAVLSAVLEGVAAAEHTTDDDMSF